MTPTTSHLRIRPTKRALALGGGALLLFGVGTNVQAGWVFAVAALLIAMLIAGLILPLRGLRGISVARSAPRTAVEGHPVLVAIDVSNTSRRTRALFRVTDDFVGRAYALVSSLGPGQRREFVADRAGARRGVYDTGVCELETGFPFGVMRVGRKVAIDSPIVVYPKTYDSRAWKAQGPAGWPAPSSMGDVSSVRDYRPGDPLRHIHWRSVARRGRLVVREFDRETEASTSVVAGVPDDPSVADAVASVACSIAIAALRDREVAVGGRRVRSSDAVLEWGARLTSVDGAIDPTEASDAIVYVGTAALAGIETLRSLASTRSVSVVLVGDQQENSAVARELRAAGALVSSIRPDEVKTWFESGCIAF